MDGERWQTKIEALLAPQGLSPFEVYTLSGFEFRDFASLDYRYTNVSMRMYDDRLVHIPGVFDREAYRALQAACGLLDDDSVSGTYARRRKQEREKWIQMATIRVPLAKWHALRREAEASRQAMNDVSEIAHRSLERIMSVIVGSATKQ